MDILPGTRIGRIRIDAVLGVGGMGTVYRGFDERLERPVALKRIRSDKRHSPALRARFLREARVLSKLDHPNICRIYDVIETIDADYLVLELIEGVTLRERMESLTREEALRIALQVARVLELAHGVGIVHRDLKPENVMLTPAGEVKVLDYGLARLVDSMTVGQPVEAVDFEGDDVEKTVVMGTAASTEGDLTQTFSGTLVGTLHYMSPEQARALPLTTASDLYSFGIVLAEMLTGGSSPYGKFISNSDLLLHVRTADIALPQVHDRELQRLLSRLVSLQPADRPPAAETRATLERILAGPATRRRRARTALAVAGLVAIVAGGVIAGRSLSPARSLLQRGGQLRIAVMPIKNATGDRTMQWMEMGLGGMVADAIGRTRGADVIAPDAVAAAVKELKLTAPESDAAQRRRLLDRLGADVVVTSTATAEEGITTIRYAVAGRESEESVHEARSSLPTEAAAQMATQLVQRIDPRASVRDRYSFDNVANMLFAMGVDAQRQASQAVAAHYFTVCLDRDPGFLAARIRLADSQHLLGDAAAAAANLEAALARARAKTDREMLATALIARAGWGIDSGDYGGAQRDAAEALAAANDTGRLRLRALAQNRLASVAWRQGQLDRAEQLFEETRRTFSVLRSPLDEARMYNNIGIVEESRHDIAAARTKFEQGLAIAERLNDRLLMTTLIGNLANAYGESNDFARAEAMTRRQLALARDIGDKSSELLALLNLGLWTWSQGRDDEGIRLTNEALAFARALGARPAEALLLSNLATAKARLGDVAGAVRDADAAATTIAGIDDPEMTADVLLGRAYALTRAGRFAEASTLIDQAERTRPSARAKVVRARLAYARGDYAGAYSLITAAKAMNQSWPIPYEQMLQAFAESSRTGRASSVAFERL